MKFKFMLILTLVPTIILLQVQLGFAKAKYCSKIFNPHTRVSLKNLTEQNITAQQAFVLLNNLSNNIKQKTTGQLLHDTNMLFERLELDNLHNQGQAYLPGLTKEFSGYRIETFFHEIEQGSAVNIYQVVANIMQGSRLLMHYFDMFPQQNISIKSQNEIDRVNALLHIKEALDRLQINSNITTANKAGTIKSFNSLMNLLHINRN